MIKQLCILKILRSSGLSDDLINHMLSSNKKAQFCMWLSLENMPDETVISTHILEFLEQALEPIAPNAMQTQNAPMQTQNLQLPKQVVSPNEETESEPAGSLAPDEAMRSYLDLGMTTAGSFPVDVVTYFSVQSSALRFTSLPYSRVECLLKLPALWLVATSRKSSDLVLDMQKVKKLKNFLDSCFNDICHD